MPEHDLDINFATTTEQDKQDPKDIGQRIFKWTITSGKKIIMIVEILILAIFLSIFKFDKDLAKLRKDITFSASILANYAYKEDAIRNAQQKIATIKDIEMSKFDWEQTLTSIQSIIPNNMEVSSLEINKQDIQITANVKDPVSFATFIHGLLKDPTVNSIRLDSSSYDTKNKVFLFSMDIVRNSKQ